MSSLQERLLVEVSLAQELVMRRSFLSGVVISLGRSSD